MEQVIANLESELHAARAELARLETDLCEARAAHARLLDSRVYVRIEPLLHNKDAFTNVVLVNAADYAALMYRNTVNGDRAAQFINVRIGRAVFRAVSGDTPPGVVHLGLFQRNAAEVVFQEATELLPFKEDPTLAIVSLHVSASPLRPLPLELHAEDLAACVVTAFVDQYIKLNQELAVVCKGHPLRLVVSAYQVAENVLATKEEETFGLITRTTVVVAKTAADF